MNQPDKNLLKQLEEFNNTTINFSKNKTIVTLFLEQVGAVPNDVAVIYKDRELSFKELDNISNRFANYLITNHNINHGDFVGLMLERSEWIIISILSILKAGAIYVPIDIESPQSRKGFIKDDSNCKITVDSALIENFTTTKEAHTNEYPLNINANPNDLAYVIYTSGTTGNPKGVMIEHQSVVNLISSQTKLYGFENNERVLLFSNYFFDASVEQLFLALFNGAAIVIVDIDTIKNFMLPNFLKNNQITHLSGTTSYIETLPDLSEVTSLKRIVVGGEVCPINLAERIDKICDFYNEYGPTENTVTSTIYKFSTADVIVGALPIGKPIYNTKAHIVSDTLELLPVGAIGELCLSGSGLARGYLNLPELSEEKFIKNPFSEGEYMYRSGDLAKWLPDGNIEFIGRKDDQVKIRGYRVELGEIETAITNLPNISRVTVIATDNLGAPRLIAYIKSTEDFKDDSIVKYKLAESLPDYMVPSLFVWMEEFPMTPNGKIDKKKLPLPEYQRPHNAPPLKKPKTALEKDIADIWSTHLSIPEIGIDDNFFEMGGNSLLTQKVAVLIEKHLDLKLPVTKIYQFPTIAGLSEFLEIDHNKSKVDKSKKKRRKKSTGDIAIIGMAGRFPGANSIEELWNVLASGEETITFFSPEELDESIPEELYKNPLYVAARGIVPTAKAFDAKFFGLNPKLAKAMDPQQRLLLEIVWELLEQSGHLPKHYNGSIAVYTGVNANSYYVNNVFPNKDLMAQIGIIQANTVNDKDYVASRIAYHMNLKGPAVSVHSACSTSLLAIAEAVEAIRSGQCDVAIAGGSSVTSPMYSGHLYQEGSIHSADGHCRSFDADAKGTVFSDGAGVVLLKSLEDAIKDGDTIHGVIKGIGINNDGGDKGSFTAPSVEGEAGAISNAHLDADIRASEISYVEAHGTATPLGDPIEVEGLNIAFGEQDLNGYCAIGSIKSNMGHLTAAAGVAGLIKTVLALKHRQIPPTLGFEKPNPAIDFENSPFYVNNTLIPWDSEGTRKAGVSSFGIGGTNVHIVVEEYVAEQKVSDASRPVQLLPWSAKTPNSLDGYQTKLGNYLKSHSEGSLADVAHSLTFTRDAFAHRSFAIADKSKAASEKLLSKDQKAIKTNALKVLPNELVFLFPGQGSQYLQMGKALYHEENVFRAAVDQCAEILKADLKLDIKTIIYPENNSENAEQKLKDTKFTQPALFVIEYALAQLWMSWGIKPTLLCGHSIGEFVAAHLAGIFSLKDALHLITVRGKLVSELPGGSMLSVRKNVEDIKGLIPDTLSIAAINSDRLTVISGPDTEIDSFSKVLNDEGIANMLLLTSHAFHSTMMNPVLDTFEDEVKKVTLNVPRVPIVSTVTAKWLTDAEATSSTYWTNHLRAAVNFSGAMETVLALEDPVLLEIGPGRALTTLSMQKKGLKSVASIASLTIPKEDETAYHTVITALGDLWLHGIDPDWNAFYKNQTRQNVELPSYVFDRKPCWLDPPATYSSITNLANVPISVNLNNSTPITPKSNINTKLMRKPILLEKIAEIIEENSGVEITANQFDQSFLELGLDSLILTQMAISFKKEFNAEITFRQLNDEFESPNVLADYLDDVLPKEIFAPATNINNQVEPSQHVSEQPYVAPQQTQNTANNQNFVSHSNQNSALSLIAQQLQLLGKQIELLQGTSNEVAPSPMPNVEDKKVVETPRVVSSNDELSEDEKKEHQKPFGAAPKIDRNASELDGHKKAFLENLIDTYNKKTAKSKAYSQKHRGHMSDPRVVTGFKPLTKELVYPIVVERSSGNRLWDLDGNEYIDTLNGFGSSLFGYQPDFIKEAIHNQVELGFEVGPQHPLAGEVSELLCEFTGQDRAALCNTGSEAVLGAMRIARTVTERSLIVAFSRSYHGINDEVIVRGSKKLKTFPAASGILPEAVQNMLILDYGTDESLAIIKERAHEIAAVLVEPVQSRRPDFRPIEFLKEVRKVTRASDTILIFDEIITGFRMHPGGAQALFGVKADLATYGKVIGGGISIGAIVGNKRCMDALDGGFWQYGDDSFPEAGVTYFAGTFVRHPLALASAKATLLEMKKQGAKLQDDLAEKTERVATELTAYCNEKNLPIQVPYYRSLWKLQILEDIPYSELLFVMMRQKGIHVWDGFPCYMTAAYTEDDVTRLINSFIECIEKLTAAGIFESEKKDEASANGNKYLTKELNKPPVSGAKLGFDKSGNPAWFVEDEKYNNNYVQIDL
ncbi:polyketide synthase [Winogradskyella bathintestinalis]|uniref:Amino acid adenylation domain-containing protein n=1 Tax=Winogradskyella bathintestinalis TaxID=3035208 RepID=A0ABT7ZTK6_9FLAO|nr:polyketide synthase [Winogradskyella bathintestinalis]MDN3492159.1 amino acid adenylation domain-containing protein [Winogradskyella bathintestinalis]